jgi:hypothetical protein
MVDVGRPVSGRPRGKWWLRAVVMVAHVVPMLWKESDVFRTPLNQSGLYEVMAAAMSERSLLMRM